MKSKLFVINNLLAQYSLGHFDHKVPLTSDLDELDKIISGIHTLGKKLKETTISRDFFSSVYNSVSTLLLILDEKGLVLDYNEAVKNRLGEKSILQKSIDSFLISNDFTFLKILKKIRPKHSVYRFETECLCFGIKTIICSCSITKIKFQSKDGYLLAIEDITEKKDSEKKFLRAVIETEENERRRLADDLHDSLGQRLTSMKMMLGVAKKNTKDKKQLDIILTSISILESSILELRDVCFNLMPNVLGDGGIVLAIKQLLDSIPFQIEFSTNIEVLNLNNEQEIAVYRVIQEFINNSIKHSEASKIKINISQKNKKILFNLSDNGKGFRPSLNLTYDHRGLDTMKSRIESHGGVYMLSSAIGKGVKVKISFDYE